MATQVLVNQKKYLGKYVALRSFTDNKVVASGDDPTEVMSSAERIGEMAAVLLFVPKEPLTCVYLCRFVSTHS